MSHLANASHIFGCDQAVVEERRNLLLLCALVLNDRGRHQGSIVQMTFAVNKI